MERADSLTHFQAYLQRRFPDRRTTTDYLCDLRQFMAACPKPWREVTFRDVDAFIDQQRQSGRKSATVKRRAAALKTFFDFLAEESGELSWPNPVRMKRHAGKQERRLPRDLSDEVLEQLWAQIDSPRDQAWFILMLRAGLRVGEVVKLKREDILPPSQPDQPARLRVHGKGQKERMVLLTPDAFAVLQAWLQVRPTSPHPEVFLNERDRGPLRANGIEYCLRRYGQRLGLQVTPHQLRHSYARQLTEAGMSITSLAKLLGHAQITTTQVYTAGADPELAQAYQQAMRRLSEPAERPVSAPAAAVPPAEPEPGVTIQPRQATPLDWEAWEPELPAAIRTSILAFVQRRLPTWKARRQGEQARRVLGELRRFFAAQQARRPIQEPGELTLADLHQYQDQRSGEQTSPQTADHTLAIVLSWLQELADQGQAIRPEVFRFRPRPRPESLPRHLSEQQAVQLEQHVASQLGQPGWLPRLEQACFFVLAHCGLRAGECLDLNRQDLDLLTGQLWIRQGKGKKDRLVYLSETAQQALKLYLEVSRLPAAAPLFVLPNGRPISYGWLHAHLKHMGIAAGVKEMTAHRLRHTLATRLLNAGMDITRIQKLLGHEYINTTQIYARVHDHTVEADYRRAMQVLERRQMPFATTPLAAADWPTEAQKMNPAPKNP